MEHGFEPFSGSVEEDAESIGRMTRCNNAFRHDLRNFELIDW